ncbi:hypothetical protein AB0D08_08290 [Kitasatospora sp. NPDC048540]|uniref:hypothetical protein n=1 Tax=unclassified Kitasatospora TaxID=2633591 RepID=UPI00069047C9|nr:hypothetical protein [Kitasatospora sp. MBT63]
MRTPVISRIVRSSAATVAALALGTGLPLTIGAGTAHACGDRPAKAAPSATAFGFRSADTVTGFVAPTPTTITAGGPKIEIGIEEGNFSGKPIDLVAPAFSLYNERASGHGIGTMLKIEELSVEVMDHGRWTPLAMRYGCDPMISTDTSALAEPLADGRAHRFVFRVGLSADAPADQTRIQIYAGRTEQGKANILDLDVEHPAPAPAPAAPAGTPTATPTKAATEAADKPAAVPAAVKDSAPQSPVAPTTAPAAAPAAELASTGPSAPTGFLFGAAGACLALGLGVLYTVRRAARR